MGVRVVESGSESDLNEEVRVAESGIRAAEKRVRVPQKGAKVAEKIVSAAERGDTISGSKK